MTEVWYKLIFSSENTSLLCRSISGHNWSSFIELPTCINLFIWLYTETSFYRDCVLMTHSRLCWNGGNDHGEERQDRHASVQCQTLYLIYISRRHFFNSNEETGVPLLSRFTRLQYASKCLQRNDQQPWARINTISLIWGGGDSKYNDRQEHQFLFCLFLYSRCTSTIKVNYEKKAPGVCRIRITKCHDARRFLIALLSVTRKEDCWRLTDWPH